MKQLDRILSEALIKNNLLNDADLKIHASNAQSVGQPLKDYLLNQNVVTEKQVAIVLAQVHGLELIDLRTAKVDRAAVDTVTTKFAWYYKIMPIHLENDVLTIASAYPLGVNAQDEMRLNIGRALKIVIAEESIIIEALKKYYGLASETIDRILTKDPAKKDDGIKTGKWVEDIEKKTDDPTVAHLVNQIILEAYKKRATDIHIEPYRSRVRFRYRIDGVLVDANLPDQVKHFLAPILSRIKIMANLSITERRFPQDGSAVVSTHEQNLDLRVSTMPTPRGESMVIRILPSKVMLFSLEKLGFGTKDVNVFRQLIEKPHGIIFLTGPTGSGKTTTLYACLNEINAPERKIITIEDPVEYEMDGITQVQVNPKVKFNFATGLRSILRHDPDILMVGEVRDPETAEIAIKTALTGHLVFSTLHTNDASSGITRLIDMGVEPYLVASSVEAFVAQRLVRVICEKCRELDHESADQIKEEIALSLELSGTEDIRIYKGKGCDHCNQTGFYGRQAIYEILMLNDAIRAAILEKPRSDYIKRIAMEEGMTTLRQSGWQAVVSGFTTPGEVFNVTVKDDYTPSHVQEETKKVAITPPKYREKDASGQVPTLKDLHFLKVKKRHQWQTKSEYDARSYPRAYTPVELRYRVMRRDPSDDSQLVSDGIEHPTVTEDISAAGLKFYSKMAMPMGSILDVKIRLGEGFRDIDCLAKICRLEEDSFENVYSVITYYLDITSADKVLINKFVQSRLNKETNLVGSSSALEKGDKPET